MSRAGLREPSPSEYPPRQHLLRDLQIFTEGWGPGVFSGLPAQSHRVDARGVIRAGVLATLVDVAGGGLALALAQPHWIATQDLTLRGLPIPTDTSVTTHPVLLRKGRSNIVLEAPVRDADGQLVAHAAMSFSLLDARGGVQAFDTDGAAPHRHDFALPGSGLTEAPASAMAVAEREPGLLAVPLGPYLGNSLGAMQGGAVAILADAAAASAATEVLGQPAFTWDLAISYLSLAKVGPVRAETQVLRVESDRVLVRVAVIDEGAQDRLCSVVTATAVVA